MSAHDDYWSDDDVDSESPTYLLPGETSFVPEDSSEAMQPTSTLPPTGLERIDQVPSLPVDVNAWLQHSTPWLSGFGRFSTASTTTAIPIWTPSSFQSAPPSSAPPAMVVSTVSSGQPILEASIPVGLSSSAIPIPARPVSSNRYDENVLWAYPVSRNYVSARRSRVLCVICQRQEHSLDRWHFYHIMMEYNEYHTALPRPRCPVELHTLLCTIGRGELACFTPATLWDTDTNSSTYNTANTVYTIPPPSSLAPNSNISLRSSTRPLTVSSQISLPISSSSVQTVRPYPSTLTTTSSSRPTNTMMSSVRSSFLNTAPFFLPTSTPEHMLTSASSAIDPSFVIPRFVLNSAHQQQVAPPAESQDQVVPSSPAQLQFSNEGPINREHFRSVDFPSLFPAFEMLGSMGVGNAAAAEVHNFPLIPLETRPLLVLTVAFFSSRYRDVNILFDRPHFVNRNGTVYCYIPLRWDLNFL